MKSNKAHTTDYFNLLQTATWIDCLVKDALAPHGITHPQFNVLKILNGSYPAPLAAKDIKARMILNSPDITRLIDRLVDKELVNRAICPDNRRKVDILISEKGRAFLDTVYPDVQLAVKDFFSHQISVEEANMLDTILNKIKSIS